jgi:predicted kinase
MRSGAPGGRSAATASGRAHHAAVTTIVLPDPSLVVLIGAAGAGKTTFAARHFHAGEVLSSDALRAIIAGDEADQRATRPAFAALHRALERRLRAGRLTVVDATNTQATARRALLLRARAAGVPAAAIVLDLPAATVRRHNAGRVPRVVDPDVVERHLAAVRTTVDRGLLTGEGFDPVVILRSIVELEAVVIERLG